MFDFCMRSCPPIFGRSAMTRATTPLNTEGCSSDAEGYDGRGHQPRHMWEMTQDPAVVVLGEDVGVNGGVFRATVGLQQRFGAARVQDAPLAEGLIAGAAIGMAAQGLKPVIEIQFMGFIYPALDQIANHMARLRNRTRGRLSCPVVLRVPHGGGIHAPEHHCESLEACYVITRVCGWCVRPRRSAPTGCCWQQSGTRTR